MTRESSRRKLTTILAADVEGYSRLMHADEEATLATLREYRGIIDGLIGRHDGRVFNTGGDSVLAEFGSPVEAVRCAISCQEEIKARNTGVAGDRRLMFRIGINLGDVMVSGDDLLGDGVNVAARLEGLAPAGGICISGSVFQQVQHRLSLEFEDLGPQTVKNIPDPVSTYRVVLNAGPDSAHARAAETPRRRRLPAIAAALAAVLVVAGAALWNFYVRDQASTIPSGATIPEAKLSIAVMPFDNLSGDPDQDYFADAITEDLITDLSRIRDAFVIARRTSFTYKDKATDLKQVASDLGVRYILEGSVRRSGEQIRINVQLIDGQSGAHVWSSKFDREITDVLSVQNEITGHIASMLKAELREAETERRMPAGNLEAWDYALRGNVKLFNPKSAEDFVDAKQMLDKAIELDPTIASAWSGLAFVHYVASVRPIPGVSVPESARLSLEAAEKSVSLDPKNAEGHWIIGVGYTLNHQPEQAVAACDTAMELNPNNDCAYVCAGLTNLALGKPGEAVSFFERSLRLNPRFRPFIKYRFMGLASIQLEKDSEAVDMLNKALASSPNDPTANFALASALAMLGRQDEARAALAKYMDLARGKRNTIEALRTSFAWMGPGFERVLEGLRRAGMPEG